MRSSDARLITDRLSDIATRDPRRQLVVDPVYGRFSYGDVAEQVERLANALRRHDLGPGDVVILQLPNWAPFLIFHLALTAIGAITATIPIVYRDREVSSVARLADAKAIVTTGTFQGYDLAAMAERVRASAPSLRHIFLVGGREAITRSGTISYEGLMTASLGSRRGCDCAVGTQADARQYHGAGIHLRYDRRAQSCDVRYQHT